MLSGDFSRSGRSVHWNNIYIQVELEFRDTPTSRIVGYEGEWARVTLMIMLPKCRQSSMLSSNSSRNVETVSQTQCFGQSRWSLQKISVEWTYESIGSVLRARGPVIDSLALVPHRSIIRVRGHNDLLTAKWDISHGALGSPRPILRDARTKMKEKHVCGHGSTRAQGDLCEGVYARLRGLCGFVCK